MSKVDLIIPQLLRDEGGNAVLDDHGRGPSKWGITLLTYRDFYPQADANTIINMSREEAEAFYRLWFTRYSIGLIVDQAIAAKTMNIGFNSGQSTVIKILQRTVGIQDDGVIGPATAKAINAQEPVALLIQFKAALIRHYEQVIVAHPQWAGLRDGWDARVNA